MFKVICIFGHVLTVNSRCYGRCYVKNLIPLCTFLKFHAHVEINSARLFQTVFNKCSRVLNLVFSRKSKFSWTLPHFVQKRQNCQTHVLDATWCRQDIRPHLTAFVSPFYFACAIPPATEANNFLKSICSLFVNIHTFDLK